MNRRTLLKNLAISIPGSLLVLLYMAVRKTASAIPIGMALSSSSVRKLQAFLPLIPEATCKNPNIKILEASSTFEGRIKVISSFRFRYRWVLKIHGEKSVI
jgi:hypothetical protein